MVDTIGGANKCAFCPNTVNVAKVPLGDVDIYMCAACGRKMIEKFAMQKIDLVGMDTMCARAGQVLTFRYLDFHKPIHIGGANPAGTADDINKFFQGAHATIVNGRLGEMREIQAALRQVRLAKRQKEEAVVAADEEQLKAKAAVEKALETVKQMQEEYDRLAGDHAEKQAVRDAAVAERKALEKKESDLSQQLNQYLGDAGRP